ncbi:hypothetical protein D3C72_1541260 [compost metagenome]
MCASASRCTPSTALLWMTVPASNIGQPSCAQTSATACGRPVHLCSPPANLGASGPRGVRIGGGTTTSTGGTGMPGSTGAVRIACTRVPRPWAACQALCGCID